jgi:hypothetical protein
MAPPQALGSLNRDVWRPVAAPAPPADRWHFLVQQRRHFPYDRVGADRTRGCRGYSMKAVVNSLADFVRAGLRPRTPLARAIAIALAVKLVAVTAIWLAWFSGDTRPRADAAAIAGLIGPTAPPH